MPSIHAAKRAGHVPGYETQARWRVDPHRDTLWNWSRASRAAPTETQTESQVALSEIDDDFRFKWATLVSELCCSVAKRQALLLNASDVRIRRRAAKILGILGPASAQFTEPMCYGLMDGDYVVRDTALWALEQLGPVGLHHAHYHLMKLNPAAPFSQQAVRHMLQVCVRSKAESSKATKESRNGLRNTSGFRFTKSHGMRSTMQTMKTSSSAPSIVQMQVTLPRIPALDDRFKFMKRELADDNPAVRYKSVSIVRKVNVEAIPMPPWELATLLAKMLDDAEEMIWEEAAFAFAKMALASREHLAHRMETGGVKVRIAAIKCLCMARAGAGPQQHAIERQAQDKDPSVRNYARLCLGAIFPMSEGDSKLESMLMNGAKTGGQQSGHGIRLGNLHPQNSPKIIASLEKRDGLSWRTRPGNNPGHDACVELATRMRRDA